ncbi:alpha/beta fold hydrolase [Salinisphaera hydrothermalis]|uniref:Poly(3-hydroxyalkanoate) depolymerase n=1 Tax=Salinisphaera hydrothermalis (strain C41B8) TaxID=1304275 RepID=A0A084IR16_SALHC|nr:alpha/beta hydrolase [Salinisphaera hydrothermalis]KEZ79150.1 poly(3-hydroxyalkanoate) depolymerase [Salinisphaera hydrothermalis C41B8]
MCASADTAGVETFHIEGEAVVVARTSGVGPPLLMCNDFLACYGVLDTICDALARPTIRFDMPGIGEAPGTPRMRRMAQLAQRVSRVCDVLDCPEVDVLGMGWGGLLAQRLARDHASRVRRLVLVATSSGPLMLPGRVASLRRLAWPGGPGTVVADGRDVRELFGGRRADECEAVASALHRNRAPSRRAFAAQLYAMAGFSSLPWLHRLTMPTLVLAGDDDQVVPLPNVRLLGLLIPDSRLSIMRGAGHWLLLERPDEASRRIEEFLDTPHPLQPGGEAV